MRRVVLISCLFVVPFYLFGQGEEKRVKASYSFNLDLLSSHLWRGFKNGNSYSIQPTISLSHKNFQIGAWAAFAGNDSYFEVDLYTEYNFKSVTISLYDYYCPQSTQMNGFTELRKHHTKHTIDAMLTWKPSKMPFKILASTMVFGDDISGTHQKQTYSTYIEPALTYSHNRFSGEVFAGYTPFQGYYANKPSFVNLGVAIKYNFKIGRLNLPVQSKVSHNPYLKSTWYMLGVSLAVKR